MAIRLDIEQPVSVTFDIGDSPTTEFGAGEYIPVYDRDRPFYDGPYEIVPTSTPQVLGTSGLAMHRDVTIGAVPSNYGLITYDGSTLTVS